MKIKRQQLGGPIEYGAYGVEKRLAKIQKYIDFTNKKVLDIGCGKGAYTIEIAKKAQFAMGVDIEKSRLQMFVQEKKKVEINNVYISLMSGEQLGFKDEIFDIIVLIETLEHISNENQCLRECRRVLKQDGKIILYVPNKLFPFETHGVQLGFLTRFSKRIPFLSWLPSKILSEIAFARSYTCKGIKKLLESGGFKVEVVDWLYPPLDRIKIPAFLKTIYRKYLNNFFESTFLKIFGVSILIIGRK